MKFLVHVHVYYKELWSELASCIANFLPDADVYITTPHADAELKQRILEKFPTAHYKVVENRGYDIAPFLAVLSSVDLSQYEYVVKLHTKRNVWTWLNLSPMPAGRWRKLLLRFCRAPKMVDKCLQLFDHDNGIGMICGHHSLVLEDDEAGRKVGLDHWADEIIGNCSLECGCRVFVAGSMFIVRAKCLAPFVSHVGIRRFDMTGADIHEGTLAHAYERAIGYAMSAQGMKIVDVDNRVEFYRRNSATIKRLFLSARAIYRVTLKPIVVLLDFKKRLYR